MRTWRGDPWYDNTQWEVDAPDDSSVIKDQSVKNFPHRLSSPSGTTLTIWVGKHVSVQRAPWERPLPDALGSEAARKAYALAETQARLARGGELRERRFGLLSGFAFDLNDAAEGWEGYFVSEPWMVRARFERGRELVESDCVAAQAVLGSWRVREA